MKHDGETMNTSQTNDWKFHRRFYKGDSRPEIQFSGEWASDGCPKMISSDISLIFPKWKQLNAQAEENVIFVAPHDDDAFLGAGLLLEAVLRSQGNAYILIVTDGQNGFFKEEEKDTIVETRKRATTAAVEGYGLKEQNIVRMHYTDGDLVRECTTSLSRSGSGLISDMTEKLRAYKATRIVMPHAEDDHIDHRFVSLVARLSVCHAGGAIWEHLGKPVDIKTILEYAVYREFAKVPDLLVEAPQSAFEKKLAALAEYERCQPQISGMVEGVRQNGSLEAFCTLKPACYSAMIMRQMYF